MSTLLEVKNLKVHFALKHSLFSGVRESVKAVDDVSFTIAAGETLGLVGESGCGKTTLGRAIVRLAEPTAGSILFEGEDLARMSAKTLRERRRKLQIIFQDPYSSLNPRMTVEQIIGEALDIHKLTDGKTERRRRITELLKDVGLDSSYSQRYPHEFSGGQRQRICIARALALNPRLLVLDEPTSALDVRAGAHIINLLRDLQRDLGLTYLFISHSMPLVRYFCSRIAVMQRGRLIESGESEALCRAPQQHYTQRLIAATPELPAGSYSGAPH
jgi:peptide/nickel transport system ATP-binding protein